MNVEKLTRRESALYAFGAYEMLLSQTDNEIAFDHVKKMIIQFMSAYLPEYDKEGMQRIYDMCHEERQSGVCRKLFDNRLQGV